MLLKQLNWLCNEKKLNKIATWNNDVVTDAHSFQPPPAPWKWCCEDPICLPLNKDLCGGSVVNAATSDTVCGATSTCYQEHLYVYNIHGIDGVGIMHMHAYIIDYA